MIKVNDLKVEFNNGMTVGDAIKIADERVDQMVIILLNGQVIKNDKLDSTPVFNNAKISVLRLVSGG